MTTYAQQARKIKENVLTLLEEVPETRNSDKLLFVTYWERFDSIAFNQAFPYRFLSEGTNPETISRARRSIQATGLYPPTEEAILTRRGLLREEAREFHAAN